MELLTRSIVLLLALASGLSSSAVHASAQAVDEYRLKGAFLYNFAKFVRWPGDGEAAHDAFSVCVAGGEASRKEVEASLSGKVAGDLPFRVRALGDSSSATGCQMIFLTRAAGVSLADLAELVADRPILVIGESPGFAAEGGMINFVLDGTKLRFEVNPSAATRAGLSISSRLLKLARVVKD